MLGGNENTSGDHANGNHIQNEEALGQNDPSGLEIKIKSEPAVLLPENTAGLSEFFLKCQIYSIANSYRRLLN